MTMIDGVLARRLRSSFLWRWTWPSTTCLPIASTHGCCLSRREWLDIHWETKL